MTKPQFSLLRLMGAVTCFAVLFAFARPASLFLERHSFLLGGIAELLYVPMILLGIAALMAFMIWPRKRR